VGERRRLFPSVRISVRAVALCASCEPACLANNAEGKPSVRCAAQPHPRNILRSLGRQEASAYAMRGGRGVRAEVEAAAYARRSRPRRTLRSHDCQRASRKLSAGAVALCASCPPLYCPGATRPRKAWSRLASRFRGPTSHMPLGRTHTRTLRSSEQKSLARFFFSRPPSGEFNK
jgi:hypothetical protein